MVRIPLCFAVKDLHLTKVPLLILLPPAVCFVENLLSQNIIVSVICSFMTIKLEIFDKLYLFRGHHRFQITKDMPAGLTPFKPIWQSFFLSLIDIYLSIKISIFIN